MIDVSSIKLIIQRLIALPDPKITLQADMKAAILRRPAGVRRLTYRASEINSPYSCDRRLVLMASEKIFTDKEPWDPGRTLVADAGSAMHELIQGILAQTGKLLGHWKCPCCHQIRHRYSCYPKDYCPGTVVVDDTKTMVCADIQRRRARYREPTWLYCELSLRTEEFGIVGRADGIWVEADAWYVLEIKNIGTEMYNGYRTVAASHAMREALQMPNLVSVACDASYQTLPKNYHVIQGAIYGGLVVDLSMSDAEFPLDHRHFGGLLVTYVDRNTFDMRTFVLPDVTQEYQRALKKAQLLNSLRSMLDMTVHATDSSDEAEAEAAQVLEAERIRKNRETALAIPAACSSRTQDKAKKCPWQYVCFPYVRNPERNVVSALPEPSYDDA